MKSPMKQQLLFLLIWVVIAFSPVSAEQDEPRNIILLIGDGMGPQQIGLLLLFKKHYPEASFSSSSSLSSSSRRSGLDTAMSMGEVGVVLSEPFGALVADSACAATQLATGKNCRPEVLGFDENGEPQATIVEMAIKAGFATGLISDTRMTHATPAAFAAHVPQRDAENEIAEQLIRSDVSVLLSGGLRHFVPGDVNTQGSTAERELTRLTGGKIGALSSRRKDQQNLLNEAAVRGYSLAFDRSTLQESTAKKILGLFTVSAMPDAISYYRSRTDSTRSIPSLLEMTEKGLSMLAANKQGFFLMVEAGQIDWAAHQNDGGRLLHEMLVIDEVAGYLVDWVKARNEARNDTLLLILSDHETGSFGISYSGTEIPEPLVLPGEGFKNTKYAPEHNFISPEVLLKLFRQRRSFDGIFRDYKALAKHRRTAQGLMRLVNDTTEFPISLADAKRVLDEMPNKYFQSGNKDLGERTVPRIDDFPAFYPTPSDAQPAILARILSEKTGMVWGTGTHTTTPVLVIAVGPDAIAEQFDGLHTMQEIGQRMQRFIPSSSIPSLP